MCHFVFFELGQLFRRQLWKPVDDLARGKVGVVGNRGLLLSGHRVGNLPATFLNDASAHSVGKSYPSYEYGRGLWAIAIDNPLLADANNEDHLAIVTPGKGGVATSGANRRSGTSQVGQCPRGRQASAHAER